MKVRVIVDHIPKNTPHGRRPCVNMAPKYITIHNTGNPNSTAKNERTWLTNPDNPRSASFHYVIDAINVVECIPPNETANHAGDGRGDGNMRSVGVEICESGDYAQTLRNAAAFVASLLYERGWGIDRLRRHYDWSGKICPRKMYDSGKWTGWEAFKRMVSDELKSLGYGADTVKLEVNGKKIADGISIKGTTYFPSRAFANAIGASIEWVPSTGTVKVTTKKGA